jgi:hypothetical protein
LALSGRTGGAGVLRVEGRRITLLQPERLPR